MPLTLVELRERGMRAPVRVVHTLCGHIVFFHDGVPKGRQGVIDPRKVILFNGGKAADGDAIYCPGCSLEVGKKHLAWVLNDDD